MQVMARKKRHSKNVANTGKVSEELVKDKSTLESVAHNDYVGGGGFNLSQFYANLPSLPTPPYPALSASRPLFG